MYLVTFLHWFTACMLKHWISLSCSVFSNSILQKTDHTAITSIKAACLPQALPPPLPRSLSTHGWDGRQSRQRCHSSVWTEWQTPVPRAVCGRVGAAVVLQRLPEEASVCGSSGCRGWSLPLSCPQLEQTGLGPALPAAREPQQLHWQQQDTAWWWWAQQIPPLALSLPRTHSHSHRARGRGL